MHINSIEEYRRVAAERKAAKAKAEAAAKTIAEVIAEVTSTSKDPAMVADLNRMKNQFTK